MFVFWTFANFCIKKSSKKEVWHWQRKSTYFLVFCLPLLSFMSVWRLHLTCCTFTLLSSPTHHYVYTPTGHNMDDQWAMTVNTHKCTHKGELIFSSPKGIPFSFMKRKWNNTHTGDEPILSWLWGVVFNILRKCSHRWAGATFSE